MSGEERTIEDATRVRHLKRGTEYEVLGRAGVQSQHAIEEGDTVVVYRDEKTHALMISRVDEFEDGRSTICTVLGRAGVQTMHAITEKDTVVVYRSEATGALTVRAVDEFEDGRFEVLPDEAGQ